MYMVIHDMITYPDDVDQLISEITEEVAHCNEMKFDPGYIVMTTNDCYVILEALKELKKTMEKTR